MFRASLPGIFAGCGISTALMRIKPTLLSHAMQLGWTQNVVIIEADLTMELREWYLKAVKQFTWSKLELAEKLKTMLMR